MAELVQVICWPGGSAATQLLTGATPTGPATTQSYDVDVCI